MVFDQRDAASHDRTRQARLATIDRGFLAILCESESAGWLVPNSLLGSQAFESSGRGEPRRTRAEESIEGVYVNAYKRCSRLP